MDLKNLLVVIDQIAEEKGIDKGRVIEAIETSIAAAYKKEFREKSEIIKGKLNLKTGELKFWQVKEVVDKTTVRMEEEDEVTGEAEASEEGVGKIPRYNPARHILIDEARKVKKDANLGDEIEFPLESKADFGRIAAQTAKQVVLQKLREAERDSVFEEFKDREGQIVSGVVQRFERGNVHVDLGRTSGIMFYNESIPGEHYKVGERLRFYVLAVQEDPKLGIILSRSHPKFVSKLFELEVPEIADGVVEIRAIAREAGSRTKVAVYSNTEGVDPVGSCVGQRGTRVMSVNNELGQEKIDIIEWSDEPERFIGNALSPAKVKMVEALERREARVLVADDQLSLAIGKGGQNVRLAAKLTSWKIDVRAQSNPEEVQEEGVAEAIELVEDRARAKDAEEFQEKIGEETEEEKSGEEISEPTAEAEKEDKKDTEGESRDEGAEK